MRRPAKIALWSASPCVLLFILFLLWRFVIYDLDAKPFCHKQMTLTLRIWQDDQATKVFPNVEGSSLRSMDAMVGELHSFTNFIIPDYRYIPGLQEGDPPDLVLFYFNRPTRWRFHVKPNPRWVPKRWIVVPIEPYGRSKAIGSALDQVTDYGEESHSLTTEQFTNRLMATLDFLRTNNRPHWQAVAKEHTAFLQSLAR